jgi:hypothetical protein
MSDVELAKDGDGTNDDSDYELVDAANDSD